MIQVFIQLVKHIRVFFRIKVKVKGKPISTTAYDFLYIKNSPEILKGDLCAVPSGE